MEYQNDGSIRCTWCIGARDVCEVVEKCFTVLEDEVTLIATQKKNLKDLKMKEKKEKYFIFQTLNKDAFEQIFQRYLLKKSMG